MSDPEARIRAALASAVETPSASHDANVLAAARAYAAQRRTRPRWYMPASLAASLVIGILVGRGLEPGTEPAASTALFLPLDATRGAAARTIPVEQAEADDWYHYIQELIAAGERREAEAHLERFNELHPDYVHQP